jgi:hypothetical protein
MSIRCPSMYSSQWLFQDFLDEEIEGIQFRSLQVKYDGEPFYRVSETFDYSNPPYPDEKQRGGHIVAELFYELNGKLVTLQDWTHSWKDDWPIRIGLNYMVRCMYRKTQQYTIRVRKENYPFWVSEELFPYDNLNNSYLIR